MVRNRLLLSAIVLAGLLAQPSAAGQITFTGNVEKDFPDERSGWPARDRHRQPDGRRPLGQRPSSNPRDVNIPDWMKAEGKETGWNFKDIRLAYDAATDALAVGVNFFGVAGDIDGDGNPNTSDPRTIAAGGMDEARFANGETVAVALDLNNDRMPDIIAGIPLAKPLGPDSQKLDGLSSFTLAQLLRPPGRAGLWLRQLQDRLVRPGQPDRSEVDRYVPGQRRTWNSRSRTSRQSASMFNAGFNPLDSTIGLQAFAAGLNDVIVGEDYVPYQAVSPQTIVPEPASLLAWSAMAGLAAAWRLRRRRPTSDRRA